MTDVRPSLTKRFAVFGTAALVADAAPVTRKKSTIVSPTSDTADLRQLSVHVDRPMTAGLGTCHCHCHCHCLSLAAAAVHTSS